MERGRRPDSVDDGEDITGRVFGGASRLIHATDDDPSFQIIADSAPVPMWVTRLDRRRSFVNRAYTDFLGVSYDEAVDFDWRQIIHPDDAAQVLAQSIAGEASLKPFSLYGRYKRFDGEWRWLHSISHPRWDTAGNHTGFIGVAHDITEAKEAEIALADREEQLSAFVNQTMAGFAQVDLEGVFTLVNDRFCEIAGRSREELMRLKMQDITHPDDLPANIPLFERAVKHGTPYAHEKRYIRGDGSIVWVHNSVAVVRKANGTPYGVLAISLDVSARKRSDAELHKAAESVRLAIEGAGMATWEIDLRTMEGPWSPNRFDILGYPRAKSGRGPFTDWVAVIHPEDLERTRGAVENCFDKGIPFEIEYRILRADNGEEHWLRSHGSRIAGADGQSDRFVGVSFDITEQKRDEMRRQLLVDELNHRVKNTLAIVQSIAQQSLGDGASIDEARGKFESRLQALAAAHNLLMRSHWQATPLRQLIVDTLASHAAPEKVRIEGPELVIGPKAAVMLALAINELATNALKYGAFSTPEGRVDILWSIIPDGRQFRLEWRESDGPPVSVPERRSFGTRMIERGLAAEFQGEVSLSFERSGLVCTLVAPTQALADG